MLSRVARQKNALLHPQRLNRCRRVSPSLATLRLHNNSSRPNSLSNASPNVAQERPRRPSFQSNRNLATAADSSAVQQEPYHSLESPSRINDSSYDKMGWLFPKLPSNEFNQSSLIIMDDLLQTKPKTLKRVRGIGGDEEEMMANLDVSLRLAQFDRASSLVTRLGEYYPVGSPEYLALHNRYLEEMVSHMVLTRQHNLILPLQRWFEIDMSLGGVQPDSTTFAIMLRMALRMLHGGKRDRTVRRYWEIAKTAGVEEEVLALPILSELELGELSEICSADLQRLAIGDIQWDASTKGTIDPAAKDSPEVRPVEQRGLGLSSLKDSLSMFSDNSQVTFQENTGYTDEENKELHDQRRQRQLEADSIRTSLERWKSEFQSSQDKGVDLTGGGKRLGRVINQWLSALTARIQTELELVADAEGKPVRTFEQKERCEYGIFLRTLDPERLAAITILAVISAFSRGGMERGLKVSAVASTIGDELSDELIAEKALEKESASTTSQRANALKQIFADRKKKDGRTKWWSVVQRLQRDDLLSPWPPRLKAKIGAVLMSLLFETAKAPVKIENPETKRSEISLQPAFQHSYQMTWGKRLGFLHMHSSIVKIIAQEPPAELLGRHLPMLCKPKPWLGMKDGAYLVYESCVMRVTPGENLQPSYIKAALENNGLEQIRTGLDILGKTAWTINNDVFDVMLEAWNSGEAIGNLAPLDPDLQLPPRPPTDAPYDVVKKWEIAMRDIENQRSGIHSNRCFQNFQMEVARAYRNETFYLPHNMDFRGRAYPLPPYLNQMGADNARGLLLFNDAKPLGASGLRWLKIQIANLTGFDKASLSEREQFTMDHLDDIIDSAKKGLHGRRWWLKAEDPWQCLAACCELTQALDLSDPTQYMSRLPIHQDGSCNGLQHYAALGGDIIGAQQVNLEPSDRPSDVYTGVAEFVKDEVSREAAEGNELAQLLDGRITRKVVKQTVMTNVYGVTFMGAMKQVRKQLTDHYPDLSNETKNQSALYIAQKIFKALGSMFNGAHEIQYWLGDCASRITQSLSPDQIEEIAKEAMDPESKPTPQLKKGDPTEKFQSTVIWTTPLGLPVVQPYRMRKARRVKTTLQELSIVDGNCGDTVSKRKQLQAFPPNFIHSLDATHMIMSATACYRSGFTFSAVHDSFWTHASDVDDMNMILREAFVRMHSDDVIKRLAAEFKVRYGHHLFLAKVKTVSPIGRALRVFRKQTNFKSAKIQELFDEHKRQQLLRSDDPDAQAEGREMVTAASLFEELGCTDSDLAISNSLGETVVGHVPPDLEVAERKLSGLADDFTDPAIQSLVTDFSGGLGPQQRQAAEDEEPKKKKTATSHMWLWLPLRFREVPTKGSWDLTRIRDSKYFFS